jgi:hypothetical protein
MISILFSPFGRYLLIGGAIIAILFGGYLKIRSDAQAEIEAQAQADALRRMEDAVRAGDSIDIRPDRLRESDRNARD